MKLTALVCAVVFSVVCFGAEPTIGVVSSPGTGEASLTNGSALTTENGTSDVRLESGVAVHLAARSSGKIFTDHAVLESGAAHLTNFQGYAVQAGQWHIESEAPDTQAVIRVQAGSIEVASIGGPVKVTDGGAMLTRVAAGNRMSFQNSGATADAQSGATMEKKPRSEAKTWAWVIVGVSAAALAIGLTAAAQGKSPF